MPSDIWTSTVSSNLARLICLSRAIACLSGGAPALASFWRSFLSLLRSFLPRRGERPGRRPFFFWVATVAAGAAAAAAGVAVAVGAGASDGAASLAAAGVAAALGVLALAVRGFFACVPDDCSAAGAADFSLASVGFSACFLAITVLH